METQNLAWPCPPDPFAPIYGQSSKGQGHYQSIIETFCFLLLIPNRASESLIKDR
jgi:hypothetical protein